MSQADEKRPNRHKECYGFYRKYDIFWITQMESNHNSCIYQSTEHNSPIDRNCWDIVEEYISNGSSSSFHHVVICYFLENKSHSK